MKQMAVAVMGLLAMSAVVMAQTPRQLRITKVTRNVNTSTSMKVHVSRKIVADAFDETHHYKLTCVEFTTRFAACPELQPGQLYTATREGNFVTFTDLVRQPKPESFASWGNYIVTLEEGVTSGT
jgi:hypothetical protein